VEVFRISAACLICPFRPRGFGRIDPHNLQSHWSAHMPPNARRYVCNMLQSVEW
jgi:hypothetical protein